MASPHPFVLTEIESVGVSRAECKEPSHVLKSKRPLPYQHTVEGTVGTFSTISG